jgi:hypothetical protein
VLHHHSIVLAEFPTTWCVIRKEEQDAEVDRKAANEALSATFNVMVLRQFPHSLDVNELYVY